MSPLSTGAIGLDNTIIAARHDHKCVKSAAKLHSLTWLLAKQRAQECATMMAGSIALGR